MEVNDIQREQKPRRRFLPPITSCAAAVIQRRRGSQHIFEQVCEGTTVLQQVMRFLDTETLKTCCLVNKNWEVEARRSLMKRCALVLNRWRSTDSSRLQLYSSWMIECDNRTRASRFVVMLQNNGSNVTYLQIDGLMPGWTRLVRGALQTWCPNLSELCLQGGSDTQLPFEFVGLDDFCHAMDRTLSLADSVELMNSTELSIFQPLPELKSLHTVEMGWSNPSIKMPAFFPVFFLRIMQSCKHLKHVFLLDLEPSLTSNCIEDSGFGILKHLARRPEITRKLETFVWRMKHRTRRYNMALDRETETQPIRFVTANRNIPLIQLGSSLKYIHWDVLHVDMNGGSLLPGVLNTMVTDNLKKMSIGRVVLDASTVNQLQGTGFAQDPADRRRWINEFLLPAPRLTIQYPVMPQLRELRLSVYACYSIVLNDLIDAVPNLYKLEIIQPLPNPLPIAEDVRWSGWIASSEPIVQHTALRFLNLSVRISTGRIIGNIGLKFPLLEELWIGHPRANEFDFNIAQTTLLDMLKCMTSLKRFQMYCSNDLHMAQVIHHISDVQAKLPWLNLYHLRFHPCGNITGHEEYHQNSTALKAKLRRNSKGVTGYVLVSWSNDLLFGGPEHYRNSQQDNMIQGFISFVKQYCLPVQFTYLHQTVQSML
jgi:hypothetical protein